MNTKSIFQSKTFWVNLIVLVSAFFPPVKAWLAANPETAIGAVTAVNVLLRFITSGRISLFGAGERDDAGNGLGMVLIWIGMTAGLVMGLPSCSPETREVLKMIPIRSAITTDYGTVGYSSKSGISIYVDRRSGK
jgi:hypothetical protein